MTIQLPARLETPILAAVHSGRYASVEAAMTEAASLLVQRLELEKARQPAARQDEAIPAGNPIWEVIDELRKNVPPEEFDKLSRNTPRDRQIADRIASLHQDAIAEDERILPESLAQFAEFFLKNPDLALPTITLTPDHTLRARWIHAQGNFVAIEFTGRPLAKLVVEVPRDESLVAKHFSIEPVDGILSIARAIGASFT